MYRNVKHLTRAEYKAMLDAGRKFRDWSLHSPMHNPGKTFYIVHLALRLTVNKVECD
jgi:hypothetical protein